VTIEHAGRVAVVTLHNPPHNLLTVPLLRSLASSVTSAASDPRTAALVLCSEGRSFCAGADFNSVDAPVPSDGEGFATQIPLFYAEAARLFDVAVPMVAAVQGAAIGAGLGLALACDLRVVGEKGWFRASFVRLGIHPGFAVSYTLPLLLGPARAADLFLTGRRVDAPESYRLGLADRLVPAGSELSSAVALAEEIGAGAPLALASTRTTLRAGLGDAARQAMAHELAEQTRLAGTADAVEGVRAALEGREPRFEGR
jgi:2-(1,2-epoxy-1,2-dihydrophenyl)acetyl-CoA isomerase